MNTHADKAHENKNHVVFNENSQKQNGNESTFQFVDNRPEAITQRILQKMAINSPQTSHSLQLKSIVNIHAGSVMQKRDIEEEELLQGKFETVQMLEDEEEPFQGKFITTQKKELDEELLQGKFETLQMKEEEEELLQGKFITTQKKELDEELLQEKFESVQKQENKTGLPDNLKSGIENLSGYSMDDVKVNYNSDKPAEIQAHAYAQGADIHIAPGQEKHLPHEAWHVVQQKQGRVRPTMQMKGKVNVNDDVSLEKEADMMGQKSFQFSDNRPEAIAQRKFQETENNSSKMRQSKAFQLMSIFQLQRNSQIIQRNPNEANTIANGHSYNKHVVEQKEWGDPPMTKVNFAPIVSNVMKNPDESRNLSNGRKAYWKGDTVVIYNPSAADKGTCFKPTRGKDYYDNLT